MLDCKISLSLASWVLPRLYWKLHLILDYDKVLLVFQVVYTRKVVVVVGEVNHNKQSQLWVFSRTLALCEALSL